MSTVQELTFNDQLVGVVVADQLILDASVVQESDLPTITGMALYAMEVQAGRLEGPYTDEAAIVYAALALDTSIMDVLPRPRARSGRLKHRIRRPVRGEPDPNFALDSPTVGEPRIRFT